MLRDHGHALVNLDATIFAEAPRLASPCARCEEVVIISYSNPEYPGCAAPWREQWLRERFPQTTRIVINPARPETLADLPEEFRAIPTNDAPETRLHHFERRYPPANRNPVAHHTESVRYGGRAKDWAA